MVNGGQNIELFWAFGVLPFQFICLKMFEMFIPQVYNIGIRLSQCPGKILYILLSHVELNFRSRLKNL